MRNRRASYAHRGDGIRRRTRIKRTLLATGFVAVSVVVLKHRQAATPGELQAASTDALFGRADAKQLRMQLDAARGELDLVRSQLARANKVIAYSNRYGIAPDLAGTIIDVSLAEGIDPELGFRLVKLESDFNERARSKVGAVGLTQLMPSTARLLQRGLTDDAMYDRHTNLRLGFRYLRGLVDQYHGNMKLALLAYNRGEVAVNAALKAGQDPTNGYDRIVTRGYKGKGVIE